MFIKQTILRTLACVARAVNARTLALSGLAVAGVALAGNRYVSPDGDNSTGKSTYHTPFRTLGTALKGLEPGDTVFILPGIHKVSKEDISRVYGKGPYAVIFDLDMSGEKGKPMVIKGVCDEDGNRPVFDFSDVTLSDEANPEGYRITGFLVSGNHLKLSDFECTGIRVTRTDHTQSENIRISNGAYNTIENVACHDGMGIGVYINNDSHHNLIVNCDGYNNYDPVSDISPKTGMGYGGNNDAFGCHVKGGMEGNIFIGCRGWNNSDDGFDLINCYSPVEISYCIALKSGYDADGTSRGDGNGFKAGGFSMKPRDVALHEGEAPRHLVANCVAADNKANGIYSNHHLGGVDFICNTSVDNVRSQYCMVNRKGKEKDANVDVEGYGHFLCGNLSVSSEDNHTLWTPQPIERDAILTSREKGTISLTPLKMPRLADGSLQPATIDYIDSLRQDGAGADFSGYDKAIREARHISGADTGN